MAIFSRRTLQRLIDENSKFLSRKQTRDHVKRLNGRDLSVEWEIVLLNVFSKLGTVAHEKVFNGKKPDLYFLSGNGSCDFLADIKTVSDEGIELKNPYEQLNDRLHHEVLKNDIKGAWKIDIGGNYAEARRDGKMVQMKLPALARFDKEIFNHNFDEFVRLIQVNPSKSHEYKVQNPSTDLTISYFPSERWIGSGSYPSYKVIERHEHLIQNSLYSGLVSKAHQLKSTGYEGVLGILVCDGGSDFLRRGKRIIEEFMRGHECIDFVLVFWIGQKSGWNAQEQILIDHIQKGPLHPELEELLSNLHLHAATAFPYPQRTAKSAVQVLKSTTPEKLGSFIGGGSLRGNEIKLSARAVLDLLAGNISYEDFPESYRHFFAKQAASGRLFTQLEIQRSETEEDDDWLKITFGEPDTATSPFRMPEEV